MPSRNFQFAVLMAVSLVFWWHPLSSTLDLAFGREEYTHILLIVPLSCALVYLERQALRSSLEQDVGWGSALLASALLVAGFAKWGISYWPNDVRLTVSMFALVVWWIGVAIFCFGYRTFSSLLFPCCFLFWIVPLPEFVLNGIVEFLQQQSASAARMLFQVVGTPVTQDGIMLSIPALDIEVAFECSGIRSTLMVMVTTMFMAQLFLRSWRRKALLIAATVPLSIARNGLRIVVIAELGTRVDPGFLDGWLHHRGGFIFFAISLTVVVVLLWILRRREDPKRLELPAT